MSSDATDAPTAPVMSPIRISHGTMETDDLRASQKFYKEFLGLHCIRHSEVSQSVWRGGEWMIVCVDAGDQLRPQPLHNRWVLKVDGPDTVKAAHAHAFAHKDHYKIREVLPVSESEDDRTFFSLRDKDGNWWEITSLPDDYFDRLFERGDVT